MRTLPRLALVLSLFAFLLPAAGTVTAQWTPFTGGALWGQMVLPIQWEGKPGFLVVPRFTSPFAIYDNENMFRTQQGLKPIVGVPTFRVVAGVFQDTRPCAAGARVFISIDDFHGTALGKLDANGALSWASSPGVKVHDRGQGFGPFRWYASFCDHWCYTSCFQGDMPQFSALVIVMSD